MFKYSNCRKFHLLNLTIKIQKNMKTYLLFKIYLAVKTALFSAILFVLAKLFFSLRNFDYFDILPLDFTHNKL
jgi:hypothetical protein